MSGRLLLSIVVLCGCFSAEAQEGAGPPVPGAKPTLEEVHAQVKALQAAQQALSKDLDATKQALQASGSTVDLERRVAALERALRALETTTGQVLDRLDQISTQDPEGRFYPRILANMETNSRFRQEMQRVTQGKLRFDNQANFEPVLYVNGVAWKVRTGGSYLPVARDVVTISDVFGQSFDLRFDGAAAEHTVTITSDGRVLRPTAVGRPTPADGH